MDLHQRNGGGRSGGIEMTKRLLLLIGLLFAFRASAADLYYAATAQGGNTGADCANAKAVSTLSPIAAGNTAHLCGTFTSALSVSSSGTSGSPSTLKFETGAVFTAAYWTGAVITLSGSYITIDGGTNGTIQATANGTSPTYANQQDNGVCIGDTSGGTNITIQNLTCQNLYVHTNNTADSGAQNTYGLRLVGHFTNTTVQNCVIHDMKAGMLYAYGTGDTNFTWRNNDAYNMDHGFFIGNSGSGGSLNGLLVVNSKFHDGGNWDDSNCTVSCSNHHDGIHYWAFGGSTLSNAVVHDNWCYGNWGRDSQNANSCLFIENSGGTVLGSLIYNNIIDQSQTQFNLGDIAEYGGLSSIYNNMLIGKGGAGAYAITYGAVDVRNNVFLNNGADFPTVPATEDYNSFRGLGFTKHTGAHDQTGLQNMNASSVPPYQLLSASGALYRTGTNLTSLGITALDSDYLAVSRPSVGAWDIGTYYFGAATPAATLTTSLSFGNQNVNTTSATQFATLSSTGTASLVVTNVTVSGMFANTGTGTCSGTSFTLAPSTSCTIGVKFIPTAAGAQSGTLTVTDNASTSPQTSALSGSGGIVAASPAMFSRNFQLFGSNIGRKDYPVKEKI